MAIILGSPLVPGSGTIPGLGLCCECASGETASRVAWLARPGFDILGTLAGFVGSPDADGGGATGLESDGDGITRVFGHFRVDWIWTDVEHSTTRSGFTWLNVTRYLAYETDHSELITNDFDDPGPALLSADPAFVYHEVAYDPPVDDSGGVTFHAIHRFGQVIGHVEKATYEVTAAFSNEITPGSRFAEVLGMYGSLQATGDLSLTKNDGGAVVDGFTDPDVADAIVNNAGYWIPSYTSGTGADFGFATNSGGLGYGIRGFRILFHSTVAWTITENDYDLGGNVVAGPILLPRDPVDPARLLTFDAPGKNNYQS